MLTKYIQTALRQAKYEILDPAAIRAIPIDGEPEGEGRAPVDA